MLLLGGEKKGGGVQTKPGNDASEWPFKKAFMLVQTSINIQTPKSIFF